MCILEGGEIRGKIKKLGLRRESGGFVRRFRREPLWCITRQSHREKNHLGFG